MEVSLKIKGMHCEACKSLIKMELEDNKFLDNLIGIELKGSNYGEAILKDLSEDDIKKIKEIINNLDNYEIID